MMMVEKIKTSIPVLDDHLAGGLMSKSITTLWATPGIDTSPFVYQIIVERLESGDKCIFLNQSKMSKAIIREIEAFGWDIQRYIDQGKFFFVDAYSGLLNAKSKEKYHVPNPRDANSITETIKKVLDDTKDGHILFVYDSISTLIDHCGERTIDIIPTWKKILNENNSTGVLTFTEWPYEDYVLEKLREYSDAIIELKAIEEKVILREFFVVSKVTWNGKAKKGVTVPFKVAVPGGVMVYIPKILVTGPYNAGKTSFIHSISDRAVSVDRFGTTIALDHGHVEYAGFSVDLFGTPGQERFDPILEKLGGESLGVIVVVDSTDPDSFPRVKEMLAKTRAAGLPYVIVANKADLPGALSPEEIRERMKLPKDVPIIPVTAENLSKVEKDKPAKLKKEEVRKVLMTLFSRIV